MLNSEQVAHKSSNRKLFLIVGAVFGVFVALLFFLTQLHYAKMAGFKSVSTVTYFSMAAILITSILGAYASSRSKRWQIQVLFSFGTYLVLSYIYGFACNFYVQYQCGMFKAMNLFMIILKRSYLILIANFVIYPAIALTIVCSTSHWWIPIIRRVLSKMYGQGEEINDTQQEVVKVVNQPVEKVEIDIKETWKCRVFDGVLIALLVTFPIVIGGFNSLIDHCRLNIKSIGQVISQNTVIFIAFVLASALMVVIFLLMSALREKLFKINYFQKFGKQRSIIKKSLKSTLIFLFLVLFIVFIGAPLSIHYYRELGPERLFEKLWPYAFDVIGFIVAFMFYRSNAKNPSKLKFIPVLIVSLAITYGIFFLSFQLYDSTWYFFRLRHPVAHLGLFWVIAFFEIIGFSSLVSKKELAVMKFTIMNAGFLAMAMLLPKFF